jgi:hypothetical protein
MTIFLSLLLAQAPVLPEIDRRALDLQARAEALRTQPRAVAKPAKPLAVRPPVSQRTAAPQRQATQQAAAPRRAAQPQRNPVLRRAAGGALDLSAITTICRAAGTQADPAGFLATLARSYALNGAESTSLRTNCAAYLAGRADARIKQD